MRRLFGVLLLLGAFSLVACQQAQEDDGDGEDTTVIKEETEVMPAPPAGEPDMKMDVEVKTEEGGGEVKVEGQTP